jgi:hypothetical protein
MDVWSGKFFPFDKVLVVQAEPSYDIHGPLFYIQKTSLVYSPARAWLGASA